jgi:MoaA/NifB/PqqE/SkfB family radical SAM enzyme
MLPLPTRYYLNLTETCNLRCAHCITFAPEKSQDGSGRVMSPEVVEALAPHLAAAAYVGLTHAGEPITSPVLEDVLRHVRRPAVVHVLTNGLALSARRFQELCALGVSSWSFSADGMSAATHDALRAGSKIDRLLARIRELSATRPANVRMGIAWTMTRSNAGEIGALIHFAAEARLDWVKLEEIVPVNEVARRESEIPNLASVVALAIHLADRLGVRLLDHTAPRTIWKCRLADDAAAARFSRDDDFTNRLEINCCRLPWELACIEPDGDVKPIDFHHPPAGNLLAQDLSEIWTSPRFILARSLSMRARPCGMGPVVCGADPGPERW